MSLVVFPFKEEAIEVVATNLETAARHERIVEVWAVAAAENAAMAEVVNAAQDVASAHGKPVRVFPQERIGTHRSGKGDGMNTALARSAERGFDRTHFYDADITNFDRSWIDGAEAGADRGCEVVRHRFPRAATDAMITWMVTRPGLAKLFPGTLLPRLGQPLGGELLLEGSVVARLATDDFVRDRSDWGIDTVLTYATSALGVDVYEHNVADGKRHALYGSLTDIRDMVLECLDAVSSLEGHTAPASETILVTDPAEEVPADLKETIGFDLEATRSSIAEPPDLREREILTSLGMSSEQENSIDATRWGEIMDGLMSQFVFDDPAWRSAVFRLWVQRVITYTTLVVPRGYDHAMSYLEETIATYESTTLG